MKTFLGSSIEHMWQCQQAKVSKQAGDLLSTKKFEFYLEDDGNQNKTLNKGTKE